MRALNGGHVRNMPQVSDDDAVRFDWQGEDRGVLLAEPGCRQSRSPASGSSPWRASIPDAEWGNRRARGRSCLRRSAHGCSEGGRSAGAGRLTLVPSPPPTCTTPTTKLKDAARARVRNDRAAFYHWAKVAGDVARIAPLAGMDIDVVRAVVAEEERRRT